MRGLMFSLFELADGEPVTVEGDWLESLCKQMQVDGRDRPNARKSLLDLQARGVLWIDGQTVSVCFRPDSQLRRVVADLSANVVDSLANGRGSDIPIDSTPRNDTTHVRQTDKTDKKEETRESARARPDLVGFTWYCQTLELLPTSAPAPGSWRDQYTYMGSKPDAERSTVAAAIRGDAWCMANKHLVSPEHVRKHWQKYLGGDARPVLKQSVATPREEIAAAREACRAAQIEVNRLRNAPFFDKEEKWYKPSLEQAEAELSKARSHETRLLKSHTAAVAS
jgi:hypothetical protein